MDAKCTIAAVAFLLARCSLEAPPAPAVTPPAKYPATPDAAWDAAFTRTSGWTGGDVAGTVDLGDGRVLWLFGDSWIGNVADGRHTAGSKMVNNAIAIQPLAGKRAEPPAANAIRFYWNRAADGPKAWIVPDLVPTTSGDKPGDPKKSPGWYWPTGGGAVVPGPVGRPRLVLFFFHIGKRAGSDGIWSFKSLGGTLATIDNIAEPVEKWHVRQFDIPYAIGSDEATGAPKKIARRKETSWGVAACVDAAERAANQRWLYIYGVRNESPLNRQLLLARASIDSPSDFARWQFYAGDEKWSATSDDAKPIADGVANELSIEQLPAAQRSPAGEPQQPPWIMVHSESPLGRKIFIRTANRPEGPWSDRKAVYSAPEVDHNRAYFAYAAKGHLALSRPDELLITYVVNANDFGAMARDASIYRPRFISVALPIAK